MKKIFFRDGLLYVDEMDPFNSFILKVIDWQTEKRHRLAIRSVQNLHEIFFDGVWLMERYWNTSFYGGDIGLFSQGDVVFENLSVDTQSYYFREYSFSAQVKMQFENCIHSDKVKMFLSFISSTEFEYTNFSNTCSQKRSFPASTVSFTIQGTRF